MKNKYAVLALSMGSNAGLALKAQDDTPFVS